MAIDFSKVEGRDNPVSSTDKYMTFFTLSPAEALRRQMVYTAMARIAERVGIAATSGATGVALFEDFTELFAQHERHLQEMVDRMTLAVVEQSRTANNFYVSSEWNYSEIPDSSIKEKS